MKVHRPVGPVLTGILHDNLDQLANSEMSLTTCAWTLSIRATNAVFGPLQPRISIRCGTGEPIVECGGNQGAVIAPHSHVGSSGRGPPWTTPESVPRSAHSERCIVLDGRVDRPAGSSYPPGLSSNGIVTAEMVARRGSARVQMFISGRVSRRGSEAHVVIVGEFGAIDTGWFGCRYRAMDQGVAALTISGPSRDILQFESRVYPVRKTIVD
ncbi:hypothetical protein ACFXO9_31620 [Nocardia tengchongensis]|uniref:hypothetical protein n=1 Tax=Nocardia tengchongensis TaxID=2055889 RepID=UPI003673E976